EDMDWFQTQWHEIMLIHHHQDTPFSESSNDSFLIPCSEMFIFNTSSAVMLLNNVFNFDQLLITGMLNLKDIFLFLDVYFTSELISTLLIVFIMVLFL